MKGTVKKKTPTSLPWQKGPQSTIFILTSRQRLQINAHMGRPKREAFIVKQSPSEKNKNMELAVRRLAQSTLKKSTDHYYLRRKTAVQNGKGSLPQGIVGGPERKQSTSAAESVSRFRNLSIRSKKLTMTRYFRHLERFSNLSD